MKRDYYKQLLTGELLWVYLCKYTLFLAETIQFKRQSICMHIRRRCVNLAKACYVFFWLPVCRSQAVMKCGLTSLLSVLTDGKRIN